MPARPGPVSQAGLHSSWRSYWAIADQFQCGFVAKERRQCERTAAAEGKRPDATASAHAVYRSPVRGPLDLTVSSSKLSAELPIHTPILRAGIGKSLHFVMYLLSNLSREQLIKAKQVCLISHFP